MLRRVVQLLALALAVTGALFIFVAGVPAGLPALGFGLVVLLAVTFERWRKRSPPGPDGPHWQLTGERFEDPGTGKTVAVLYNRETGERRYQSDEP
jgi:hypothetical protein